MTTRELYIEVERRLHLINPELLLNNKLSSDTIISAINEGIDKFWKTRYSGINVKREGFELTLKRTDDLRALVKKAEYSTIATAVADDIITINKYTYQVGLPSDYALLLGDTAGIVPVDGVINDCWETDEAGTYITKYSDTIEGTIETLDRIKENSLSEFHLHYTKAKPIKTMLGDTITLYTDGKYKVSQYVIEYLKIPTKLDLRINANVEYTDLPTHTHMEIVKMAVLLIVGTNPNYNIYSNEVNTME